MTKREIDYLLENTRAMDLYPGWITYRQNYFSLKRYNEPFTKIIKTIKKFRELCVIPRMTHKVILADSGHRFAKTNKRQG